MTNKFEFVLMTPGGDWNIEYEARTESAAARHLKADITTKDYLNFETENKEVYLKTSEVAGFYIDREVAVETTY
jgi:hypothetical protein